MIIYPAIDIREGRVVRLLHGDPEFESVYADDPVGVARQWAAYGAKWIHMVNLDGALGEDDPTALQAVQAVAKLGVAIQFGGGIRSLEAIQQALDAGVTRVIVGTLVVDNPDLAPQLIERFGAEAVIVALDAKNRRVATHGWQNVSEWTPVDLGKRLAEAGFRYALYTDVSKDGALTGANISATASLAHNTGLEVIASGGVAHLNEIRTLKVAGAGINGVVIGRALYAGIFTLEEALRVAAE
ncbi:MAG: 1-(5-phosphoribosyl)-5-[(5-phosphoribosylamino)methylideneamino]imidazole-4-carboxamide isomerase [Anaerolineales bacterium]|nr:1-(5-phosphoribosyl)-5-[(5-phosphoribosylamino)methylideneamino]imidazole-4-carboxamide isomerase [Anaerolineales bacterium]